jgi:two-component system sensor histidine kinase KdpD
MQRAGRSAIALMVLLGLTSVFRALGFANATTVALGLLLAVLAIATVWGLLEAIVASIAATLCFNYFFLPPVGTWTIADPQNWVALFAFLAVSIVASQLSERARRKALEAVEHQQETERLYTLSRLILLSGAGATQVAGDAVKQIRQAFDASSVVLFHRESEKIFRAGELEIPLSEQQLKEVALQGNVAEDAALNFVALPVSLGGKILGSLAIRGVSLSDGARQAIANLVAIALESAQSREVAGRAELMQQSEQFKATLLDALAHELKTPLTSLKAGTSALLSLMAGLSPNQRELISVIDEETDRLNRLVSEVIQLSRIEAGKLRLHREARSAEELIQTALEDSKRLLEGRKISVQARRDLPAVSADFSLLQTVLRQLIDNAAKYSAAGSPLRIAAEQDGNQVRISVADEGPGLNDQELSRIFEKYFRGAGTRELVPGIGMGLAIAREIVTAHGGRIWAESSPGRGTRLSFTLPVETEKVRA